jgi:hypothetical protein
MVDEKNKNNRIYPLSLVKREVARVQKAASEGALIGCGDHPKSGLSDLKTASHLVKKVWVDEDSKTAWAELAILPTETGKKAQTIIRSGGKLGVSAAGFGTVDEKTRIVKDDYVLRGIDIVLNPSFEKATFDKNSICESVDLSQQAEPELSIEEAEQMGLIASSSSKASGPELTEEKLMAEMEKGYKEQLNTREFRGSFEQFRAKYEEAYRQYSNMPENPKMEELKKKVEQDEGLNLLYKEYRLSGGRKIFTEWKKAEGKRLLEERPIPSPKKVKVEEPDYSKLTEAQVYSEAMIAGVSPTRMLEILRKNKR